MSVINGAADVLSVANNPKYSETGGGHGAKGVDFHRFWAVFRMIELERDGADDFLLLFESVQDVAELDSATAPTRARVYQVKKKDSGTWTWSELTGTVEPKPPAKSQPKPGATPAKAKTTKRSFARVPSSTLGKLQLSLNAFTALPVEGVFLSNLGCDFPLAGGGVARTAVTCTLADLAAEHVTLLTNAFASLSPAGGSPDLTRVKLQKVAIHPDNLTAPLIEAAIHLLEMRSPQHAGQAQSFVDSLVLKVSPLTRRTDKCLTLEDLVKERGFSRSAFLQALADLQTVPDRMALLERWISQLQAEGMDFMACSSVHIAAASSQRDRLTGGNEVSRKIDASCDAWIAANPPPQKLRPYLDAALAELKVEFSSLRDNDLMGRFLMRAITKCADQT